MIRGQGEKEEGMKERRVVEGGGKQRCRGTYDCSQTGFTDDVTTLVRVF